MIDQRIQDVLDSKGCTLVLFQDKKEFLSLMPDDLPLLELLYLEMAFSIGVDGMYDALTRRIYLRAEIHHPEQIVLHELGHMLVRELEIQLPNAEEEYIVEAISTVVHGKLGLGSPESVDRARNFMMQYSLIIEDMTRALAAGLVLLNEYTKLFSLS